MSFGSKWKRIVQGRFLSFLREKKKGKGGRLLKIDKVALEE